MNVSPQSVDAGYSPDLTIELMLVGERFDVAELAPGELSLRNPRPMPPGCGVVRLFIDGNITQYEVELFAGISTLQDEQPYRMISVAESIPA